MDILTNIMSSINTAFQQLGSTIVLPIVLFIISVIFGAKPGKAFRAALLFGVAFTGLNVILTMMVNGIGPAVQAMVTESGVNRPVMDLTWVAGAGLSWASPLGIMIIPLSVILNIILLRLKLVRIVSVDVWNMWHYAWTGLLTFTLTGNLIFGFIAAGLVMIINTILADSTAEIFSSYYKVPGVVGYTAESVNIRFTAVFIRWIFKKLGLLKIQVNSDTIRDRLPMLVPEVVGLALGILIGILGHLKELNTLAAWSTILQLGMILAAAMVLLPIVCKMLMEGLIPIVDVLKRRAKKWGLADMYIGVDDVMVMGETNTMGMILLLQPIIVILMILIPWNRVVYVDLIDMGLVGGLGFAAVMGGNIFASVLGCSLLLVGGFFLMNLTTPLFTQVVSAAGTYAIPAGVGANNATYYWTWTSYLVSQFFSTVIGPVLLLAAAVGFAVWLRRNRVKWLSFCGYNPEVLQEVKIEPLLDEPTVDIKAKPEAGSAGTS
jgi:PTS system galactitol-specific IIC component